MNAPMMTPMIPTKELPFGKWSPIAAFDFDVFAADEEPEVLLAEVPLVAVALATCGDKEQELWDFLGRFSCRTAHTFSDSGFRST
jgi:hypothetical protein